MREEIGGPVADVENHEHQGEADSWTDVDSSTAIRVAAE